MSQMPNPYPSNIHEIVGQLASQGMIDPVENIKQDKVYIWHGTQDSVVPYCEYFSFFLTRVCRIFAQLKNNHFAKKMSLIPFFTVLPGPMYKESYYLII